MSTTLFYRPVSVLYIYRREGVAPKTGGYHPPYIWIFAVILIQYYIIEENNATIYILCCINLVMTTCSLPHELCRFTLNH